MQSVTDKDKALIQQAYDTIWEAIGELIEQADSEAAKETMKDIQARKYYREKFRSDNY